MQEIVNLQLALTISIMQEGEIFDFIPRWLHWLPEKMKKPVYDCPVCMAFWHGAYLYVILNEDGNFYWLRWLLTLIVSVGINAIIVKLWPKECECEDYGSDETTNG
jgi:hypothetical protein